MKKTVIIVLFLWGCKQPPTDCSKFKNGSFIYESSIRHSITHVNRDDTIQFERNLVTGAVAKCRVSWVSSCEYELQLISASGYSTKGQLFLTRNINHVTITEIGDDYYKAHSVIKGEDRVVERDYVFKVVK